MLKIANASIFILVILFSMLVTFNKDAYGETSIGLYLGYSFVLEEKHYRKTYYSFTTMETTDLYGLNFQHFPKNKRLGVSLEFFRQNHYAVVHRAINDVEVSYGGYPSRDKYKESLMVLILNIDYRLFSDKRTRFNPYATLGLAFLSDTFVMGSSNPCPSDGDLKVGGGIRYKITDESFINFGIVFFPANSFSSVRLGLEFAL